MVVVTLAVVVVFCLLFNLVYWELLLFSTKKKKKTEYYHRKLINWWWLKNFSLSVCVLGGESRGKRGYCQQKWWWCSSSNIIIDYDIMQIVWLINLVFNLSLCVFVLSISFSVNVPQKSFFCLEFFRFCHSKSLIILSVRGEEKKVMGKNGGKKMCAKKNFWWGIPGYDYNDDDDDKTKTTTEHRCFDEFVVKGLHCFFNGDSVILNFEK